jgi:hypothetical protein
VTLGDVSSPTLHLWDMRMLKQQPTTFSLQEESITSPVLFPSFYSFQSKTYLLAGIERKIVKIDLNAFV